MEITSLELSTGTVTELLAWYKVARAAEWRGREHVHRHFPSVDQAGKVLVFNIRQNRFRLITVVVYRVQRLYVKARNTTASSGCNGSKGDQRREIRTPLRGHCAEGHRE